MRNTVGIIGAGVVGTAVGIVLAEKGYEITGIFDVKPESTKMLCARTGGRLCPSPHIVAQTAEILFITVSDTQIKTVVDQLAEQESFQKEQMIIHMSGALSSETLSRAREGGARTVSIHPLQAFASPEQAIANLAGSVFSIEGEPELRDDARRIVDSLGGEYFYIEAEAKPMYHAGACVVSNYLVTVIDFGIKMLETTGIPRDMAERALMPLIKGTVKNVENIGLPRALTGPISRGDLGTVAGHLDCMEKLSPEQIYLYSWLGYYTARVALEKGSIDQQDMEDLQGVFLRQMTNMAAAS